MRKANEFVTIGVVSALTLVGSLGQAAEPAPARRLSTVTFTHPVTPQQLSKSNERTFRSRAPHLQETPAQQRFVDVPPTSPFSGQSKYNDITLKRGATSAQLPPLKGKALTFTLSTTTPAPPAADLGSWAKADGLDVTWDVAEYRNGAGGFNDLSLDDSSGSSALRRTGRFAWKDQHANLGMNHAEPSAVAVESLEIAHEGFLEDGEEDIQESVAFYYQRP